MQLSASAGVQAEATYYNDKLSLWEPVLETLERADGKPELWDLQVKVSPSPSPSPALTLQPAS